MSNPTLLTLAHMAYKAYIPLESGSPLFEGNYQAQSWKFLGKFGEDKEGFVGCLFIANDGTHSVVAYAGTDGANAKDLKADFNISIKRIPKQIESAKKIFEMARQIQTSTLYVVGHSLGGALAQVVGTLKQVPFATFNAPGMKLNLEYQGIAYKDSWKLAKGVNYRLKNDWIGTIGEHLGQKRVLDQWGTVEGVLTAHTMGAIIDFLKEFPSYGNLTPLPLDTQ